MLNILVFIGFQFAIVSFLIFSLLEIFPSLQEKLPLSGIRYYAYKSFIPDDELVYRKIPFKRFENSEWKGDGYSPSYNIEVPSMTYKEQLDENGFRNPNSVKSADVVIMGDSFMEIGHDEADTFSERLKKISGIRTYNLGRDWYGPIQYLIVLRKYGIERNPKFALFCVYEGNDFRDIRQYMRWKKGGPYWHFNVKKHQSFFIRYVSLIGDLLRKLRTSIRFKYIKLNAKYIAPSSNESSEIHPDLLELRIGNKTIISLFGHDNNKMSPDDMLGTKEWIYLKETLIEFKEICFNNNITPIAVFIPTKGHIYAEFSTSNSGNHWLERKDDFISSKDNRETAFVKLLEEVQIRLINLTTVFQAAAKSGEFLYYPFDTHWNSAGREVAASFVDLFRKIRDRLSYLLKKSRTSLLQSLC
jgi:hypothetical protein